MEKLRVIFFFNFIHQYDKEINENDVNAFIHVNPR